jgi:type IV secretion system protein VirB10
VLPPPTPIIRPALVNTEAERTRAAAVVFDNGPGSAAPALAAAQAGAPGAAVAVKPPPQGLSAEEQFAQRLGGENATASATRMKNPSTTVAEGTLMTAMLETAIDSDLSGFVRAVISRDVKSYDGTRVLIPRSSHVIGQYQSGLAVGQTRAYVLWTRLIRPDGVSIALGSPATDFAGRNGLSGKVDGHFMKRFGSAILLSLIGAGGQAIGGSGTAVIIGGPQAAASASAQRDMNIPPTVRVNQGTPIRIFTARDLDFSTVGS